MIHRLCLVLLFMTWVLPHSIQAGVLGSIILNNGSIIHGDIVEMVEGTLKVEAAFGAKDPFLIKWGDVTNIATSQPMNFVLYDGSNIRGIAEKADEGILQLSIDPLSLSIPIQLQSIAAINPPLEPPVKYKASIQFGGKLSSGNTDDAQANFLGGFQATSERLRLILDSRYFYAEEDKKVTDRNAFGTIDMHFFLTKRSYLFLATLLEQDTFDDLNLRMALTTGPGYEFIQKGDFDNPYFSNMSLQADVGAGIWNEDRKIDNDINHGVYRWSLRWEWTIIPNLTFFHRQLGFPELGNASNFYVNSLQGVRVNIWKGLHISAQVNYKYDNEPAEDSVKGDTKALVTIGYNYGN